MKEAILSEIEALEIDEDKKVALMEKIDDAFNYEPSEEDAAEIEALKAEVEEYKMKYEDLRNRYKARFLGTEEREEEEEKPEDAFEEEKKVIDIKEI